MNEDKLTDEYKAKILKNEQELDELKLQSQKIEEKEDSINSWEQWDTACLNRICSNMRHESLNADRLLLEDLLADTQKISRQAKRQLEQEREDINRNRKRLYEQADEYRLEYQRKPESADRGDEST